MTELPPGEYRLIGPDDKEVFHGGLRDAMEIWPGTQAQRQAVENMYRVEKHKQDAEAQLAKAQDQALQLAHVANDLITLCEAYVSNCEAREQEARDREASKAEAEEQERLAAIAAELKPIIGPDGELQITPDDGELEIKHKTDPEKHGYEVSDPSEEDNAEGTGPVPLSYGTKPSMSYVKSEGTDPMPIAPPGEPEPEPGSRLYDGPPKVGQIPDISLNSEEEST
jgi:hypothetical protein